MRNRVPFTRLKQIIKQTDRRTDGLESAVMDGDRDLRCSVSTPEGNLAAAAAAATAAGSPPWLPEARVPSLALTGPGLAVRGFNPAPHELIPPVVFPSPCPASPLGGKPLSARTCSYIPQRWMLYCFTAPAIIYILCQISDYTHRMRVWVIMLNVRIQRLYVRRRTVGHLGWG